MTPETIAPATPADDRADLDTAVEPGRPGNLKALIAIWRDRDVAYAKGTRALNVEQIAAIRLFRKKEAEDLPKAERARAWTLAHIWFPPQHGQGTGDDAPDGLRSWL